MPRVSAPLRGALAFTAGLISAGCAVGPNFHPPAPPQTDRYSLQPLPGEVAGCDSASPSPE